MRAQRKRHASRVNYDRNVRISACRIHRERQIARQLARRIVRRGMCCNESTKRFERREPRGRILPIWTIARELLLRGGVADVQDICGIPQFANWIGGSDGGEKDSRKRYPMLSWLINKKSNEEFWLTVVRIDKRALKALRKHRCLTNVCTQCIFCWGAITFYVRLIF